MREPGVIKGDRFVKVGTIHPTQHGESPAMKPAAYPFYPTLLQKDNQSPPTVPSAVPFEAGTGVIDGATFRAIEVDKLFESIDHTVTRTGQAVLYRSLARPLGNFDNIVAKQKALAEIEADSIYAGRVGKTLRTRQKTRKRFL